MNKLLATGIHNPLLPDPIGNDMSATGGLTAAGLWVSSIVSLLIIVAAIFTLIYLVNGGLSWITSSGDKAKLEKARDQITNGIIGLIIVAAAWAVWLLIGKFLGINFDNMPFPSLNTANLSLGLSLI